MDQSSAKKLLMGRLKALPPECIPGFLGGSPATRTWSPEGAEDRAAGRFLELLPETRRLAAFLAHGAVHFHEWKGAVPEEWLGQVHESLVQGFSVSPCPGLPLSDSWGTFSPMGGALLTLALSSRMDGTLDEAVAPDISVLSEAFHSKDGLEKFLEKLDPEHPDLGAALRWADSLSDALEIPLLFLACLEPETFPGELAGMRSGSLHLAALWGRLGVWRLDEAVLESPMAAMALIPELAARSREKNGPGLLLDLLDAHPGLLARRIKNGRFFHNENEDFRFGRRLAECQADLGPLEDPRSMKAWMDPPCPDLSDESFLAATFRRSPVFRAANPVGNPGSFPALREISRHPEILGCSSRPGQPEEQSLALLVARACPARLPLDNPAALMPCGEKASIPFVSAVVRTPDYPDSWPAPLPRKVLLAPGAASAVVGNPALRWKAILSADGLPVHGPGDPGIWGNPGSMALYELFRHLFALPDEMGGKDTPVETLQDWSRLACSLLDDFLAPESQSAWEAWTVRRQGQAGTSAADPWETLYWSLFFQWSRSGRYLPRIAFLSGRVPAECLNPVLERLARPALLCRSIRLTSVADHLPPTSPRAELRASGQPVPWGVAFGALLAERSRSAPPALEHYLPWFRLAATGLPRNCATRMKNLRAAVDKALKAPLDNFDEALTLGTAIEETVQKSCARLALNAPGAADENEPLL
jgi:hypothetical protein